MDVKIAGKFRLGKLIGKGSFGEVFIGLFFYILARKGY